MSQLKEGMFSSNSSNQTNVFSTSLTFAGNLGHLTWVRHSSRKSSAARSYQRVWYFHVSKQWYGCQCLEFLTSTQMLMHATANGGCTNTARESALKVEPGRKIATPGPRTRFSSAPWFSNTLPAEMYLEINQNKRLVHFSPTERSIDWKKCCHQHSSRCLMMIRPE